jgi:hypothetical protein
MKNPSKNIFGIHDVDQGTRRTTKLVRFVGFSFTTFGINLNKPVFQACVKV